MGLKNAMLLTIQKMTEQPCSDPSCHCVIHKWIPKGDVIAFLLSARPSSWNARTRRHDTVELPRPARGEVAR
jgi:hypothetical protein